MTDRIITREISAHHAWQGPESEAPAFCNDAAQLAALAEEVDMAECRAFSAGYEAALGAESNIKKFNIAPSGDLISREAAVALVEAECSRILSKQGGKNDAVDMNIRFIALMLPDIANRIRALPAQGQPAAPDARIAELEAENRRIRNSNAMWVVNFERVFEEGAKRKARADKAEAAVKDCLTTESVLRASLRKCVAMLDALVTKSGRGYDWGEEDPFRMGEWFEDDDLAHIERARILSTLESL